MRRWVRVVAVAACVLFAALEPGTARDAVAEAARKPGIQKKVDANSDGSVTTAEWVGFWTNRYETDDPDGDGKLSLDEFLASMRESFKEMDSSGDGVVTVEEYITYWVPKGEDAAKQAARSPKKARGEKAVEFQEIDSDRSGALDYLELATFWDSRFIAGDANGDGKMSLDEFLASAKERFKGMDVNGDGIVTVEEHITFWGAKGSEAGRQGPQPTSTTPAGK